MDIDLKEPLEKRVKCINYNEYYKIKKFHNTENLSQTLLTIQKSNEENSYIFTPSSESRARDYGNIKKTEYREELKQILFESCPGFIPIEKDDKLLIALHIRNGEKIGFSLYSKQFYEKSHLSQFEDVILPSKKISLRYLDLTFPAKAPPLQFYVDAISYFVKHISSNVKFIIFTDYEDKLSLIDSLLEKLESSVDIELYESSFEEEGYRELDEILTMSFLDGIIKPAGSTFSIIPLYLADFSYCIYPCKYHWEKGCLVIDNIYFYSKEEESIRNLIE